MGRIVVSEFVSLDGVMEDPGGAEGTRHAGWTFRFERGPEGDRFKLDEVLAAEALLLGRVTYQGFAAAWPSMQDPVGFAQKMNSMPKFVISSTLADSDATWQNSTVLRGDAADAVTQLRTEHQGDLLVGGAPPWSSCSSSVTSSTSSASWCSQSCLVAASASSVT